MFESLLTMESLEHKNSPDENAEPFASTSSSPPGR
jgi:hypothetical protein